MFQAVPPTIIRSSKLYIHHRVTCQNFNAACRYRGRVGTQFQFIYLCEMLYMFQAVPPPIIRSSKLYIQHRILVKPLLMPAAIVEELERSSNLFICV
jgi:hypothetical protein